MQDSVVSLFHQLAQNDFGFFQRLHSLADIMSRDVKTLTLDNTHEEAADFLRNNHVHHAPVVEDGDVIGIVSDRDLLRHRPPKLGTAAEGDHDHLAMQHKLSQIMIRNPISVPVNANPIVAINLMLEHHIDCLLVRSEQGKLSGIVTTRDFMKMVLLFHRVCTRSQELERLRLIDLDASRGLPVDVLFSRGARSVRDVMTKDLKCLSETDSIETAMATMQKHAIRHLPVVDSSMRLLGMVSDRQILRTLPLPVPNYDPRRQYGFREVLFAVRDSKPLKQSVATIMNAKPTVADPASHLVDSIEIMLNQSISGIAVVDPHRNRLCGILTAADILRVFRVALQIGSHVAPQAITNAPIASAPTSDLTSCLTT